MFVFKLNSWIYFILFLIINNWRLRNKNKQLVLRAVLLILNNNLSMYGYIGEYMFRRASFLVSFWEIISRLISWQIFFRLVSWRQFPCQFPDSQLLGQFSVRQFLAQFSWKKFFGRQFPWDSYLQENVSTESQVNIFLFSKQIFSGFRHEYFSGFDTNIFPVWTRTISRFRHEYFSGFDMNIFQVSTRIKINMNILFDVSVCRFNCMLDGISSISCISGVTRSLDLSGFIH